MVSREVEVCNKLGLHARAAARLVRTASSFSSAVQLSRPGGSGVDCKSIFSVLMLAAGPGTRLVLSAEGSDEAEASEAVGRLFSEKFGEQE
jgi:phosphocarrier protein HPr